MSLSVVSLFSGIGLIDLGLHRAGMTTRLLCEADKACRGVLARQFPDTPIHPDVQELTADDLYAAGCDPDQTVVAAGFPCQDLSVAGRQAGLDRDSGSRSALYWHVDRLLGEFRPRWVVLENVPGLLSSRGGRDMGAVLGSLADRGYGFAWRVLDAQKFGVPQRRRRVVIVGHLGEPWSAPCEVLFEPPGGGRGSAQVGEAGQVTASATRGRATGAGGQLTFQKVVRSGARLADGSLPPEVWERREVSATLSPFDLGSPSRAVDVVVGALQAHRGGPDDNAAQAGHLVASEAAVRRLTPLECERLQGAPGGWTDGQSDSARYRQLGNSVAVPVFGWVGIRLAATDAALRMGAAA